MIEEAIRLARKQFAVLPVHSVVSGICSCHRGANCESPAKHPRIKAWQKVATTAEDTIRQWWTMWPSANIGVATGKASSVFVVDVDPRNDGWESLEKLQRDIGELPPTLTVRTGSDGRHYYLRIPAAMEVRDSQPADYPGIDIKGGGGMVVAPPSLHLSGNRYNFMDSMDVPIAEAPANLLRLITKAERAKSAVVTGSVSTLLAPGQRNTQLTSFAGSLRKRGLSGADIDTALQVLNSQASDPLDAAEVSQIAYGMERYEPGRIYRSRA